MILYKEENTKEADKIKEEASKIKEVAGILKKLSNKNNNFIENHKTNKNEKIKKAKI